MALNNALHFEDPDEQRLVIPVDKVESVYQPKIDDTTVYIELVSGRVHVVEFLDTIKTFEAMNTLQNILSGVESKDSSYYIFECSVIHFYMFSKEELSR